MSGDAKARLRAQMRAALAAITPAERVAAGESATERLAGFEPFRAARRVALFLATERELPTAPVIALCVRAGRAMAVPAFDLAAGRYRLAHFEPDAPRRRAAHGIEEPLDPQWLQGESPDLWLVPGLAFDARGGRLGRGGGWYDRLLKGAAGARVGWAFDRQVVDRVPMAVNDAWMDWVITERRVLRCAAETDADSAASPAVEAMFDGER